MNLKKNLSSKQSGSTGTANSTGRSYTNQNKTDLSHSKATMNENPIITINS